MAGSRQFEISESLATNTALGRTVSLCRPASQAEPGGEHPSPSIPLPLGEGYFSSFEGRVQGFDLLAG